MYNKIAPIILNAGKNASFSDVFVAQPDSLKENLAGKIFILAEISAKKNEGRLIFDFLIEALENYYYNDEKILLKDKIEGLRLENIFEAAIARVNKDLNEFLIAEKIRINVPSTSITIGVIFENKLYFSCFGKNRALLIYRRNEQYEIINVETSASEVRENKQQEEDMEYAVAKEVNIFSSVISGEIPINSYFFFTSEALPEYLSNKELITIITKLPPIVAAEQIKNSLEKINTYVPFLGVLIKNTIGLNISESREEFEETLTTHSTISTLNHTEQKTERILAPAGVINLAKIFKKGRDVFGNLAIKRPPSVKRSFKPEEDKITSSSPIDLGRVRSLNMARSDSFLVKEKIFFKKKPGEFLNKLRNVGLVFGQILNPRNWLALILKLKDWFKTLNTKNTLLFGVLIIVVVVFFGSIIFTNINHKKQTAQNLFESTVASIEDQENAVDAHLLYNDEDGARAALVSAQSLINSLAHEKASQKIIYDRLNTKLSEQSAKIQKLVLVANPEKTNDLTGLNLNNIYLIAGNIYGSDGKTIFNLTVGSASSTRFDIAGATNLSKPTQNPNDKNYLYYLNDNQIVKFDLKKKTAGFININNSDQTANLSSFKIYGSNSKNLYSLTKNNNQIYKYSLNTATGFSTKSNWLTDNIDLSQSTDLFVADGDIYLLKNSGEVLKLYAGKRVNYTASALAPVMNSASKLYVGVKYIYLFDLNSKRLAVLNKTDGHLLNQYQIDSLNNPRDFAVNEDAKQAFFLADGGIYRINLNQ